MNTRLLFLLLSFFMLFQLISNAQQGNVWAFGVNAGVDFNRNPPQSIQTSINTREGSASICDDNGRLLFYTDGTDVWDKNHAVMPNGKDLPNLGVNVTASTTQGALIVPRPGNPDQYYVFSIGCNECNVHTGKLFYSIIDMSLNNGLGAVVPGIKGILLDEQVTEHMTAVTGDNCDIWLLVLSRSTTAFKAYNIGPNGINANPVLSTKVQGGGPFAGILGSIDVSPDRTKLAVAQGNLILYDFNPGSGTLINTLILDKNANESYYGVSFSPDNTKLYASTYSPLYQYDLSINNADSIIASKELIAKPSGYPAIKRGPDGKVYCAGEGNALNVINQPNLAGAACQYVANGFPLLSGTGALLGLPNSATIVTHRTIYHSKTDTAFCTDSLLLEPNSLSGSNYTWEDGSTGAQRKINKSGTYWVSYLLNSPCILDECVDTFKVVFDFSLKDKYTVTSISGICTQDTLIMEAGNLYGSNYIWEDHSLGKQRKVNQTGTYWVSYQNDSLCEHLVDTFKVTYPLKAYQVSFIADTLICEQAGISFENTSDAPFNQFNWAFGDENTATNRNPIHSYREVGTYQVQLIGKIGDICPDTAYATLIVDPVIPVEFLKDRDRICVGESITFSHQVSSNTLIDLRWELGDGTALTALGANRIRHAYDKAGATLPVSLNASFRICPDDAFTDTISVAALPEVDLGADQTLCLNGAPIILRNLHPETTGSTDYLWSTGDTSETLKVVHPGIYHLTVSSAPLGCSTTESITIVKDCYMDIPNAFTPNGDGENDYFFPRQLLGKDLISFRMLVYNRWGQMVFETTNIGGRGWDGAFNGKLQPQGVYLYLMDVVFANGIKEHYQGNVTLFR